LTAATVLAVGLPAQRAIAQRFSALALFGHGEMSELSPLSGVKRKLDFGASGPLMTTPDIGA
jgi:hypothetical protein